MHPNEALFANEAFYLAFAEGDLDAMSELWARDHPVICIHPGWTVLAGRERVLESWRDILTNPDRPKIRCYGAAAYPLGPEGPVAVTGYEVLPGGVLTAMNLFVQEGDRVCMVHHQAGPCNEPPAVRQGPPQLDA